MEEDQLNSELRKNRRDLNLALAATCLLLAEPSFSPGSWW
jgi:hypothetical protein